MKLIVACVLLAVMAVNAEVGCWCSCSVNGRYRVVGSGSAVNCTACTDGDWCATKFPRFCTENPLAQCTDQYSTWEGVYNVLEGSCFADPSGNGEMRCVNGCDEKNCDCLVDKVTIKKDGDKLVFTGFWQKAGTTIKTATSGTFNPTGAVSATGNMTGIGAQYDAVALTVLDPTFFQGAMSGNVTHRPSPFLMMKNPAQPNNVCDVIGQLDVKGQTQWLKIGLIAGGGVLLAAVLFYFCCCAGKKKADNAAINQPNGYRAIA